MRKKHFAAGFMALMMLIPVSASAHCGGYWRTAAAPVNVNCEVCSIEDCTTAGRHIHDGVTYCGYAHADGICDGTCYALCAVEGCTLSGRHSHDGTVYCGANHGCGFCDGTCQQVLTVVRGGGHHGRHRHC